MRAALPLALGTLLLAGCVAQSPYEPSYYPPRYRQPSPYEAPPTDYRTRPLPPPQPEPLPPPERAPGPEPQPEPTPDTGPIPLIEMPAPTPESNAPERPADTAPAPAAAQPAPTARVPQPTSGPGSNVPLEGFRPMRGQTKPTP